MSSYREVGRAKDLSAPLVIHDLLLFVRTVLYHLPCKTVVMWKLFLSFDIVYCVL